MNTPPDIYVDWAETRDVRSQSIPFAIDRHGNWRDAHDVQRGRACACVCPECNGPVIAKKGEILAHHFAHDSRAECRNALEASLFGMALSILAEPKAQLQLPGLGDRHQLAGEAANFLAPKLHRRFFASRWIVEPEAIAMTGAHFHGARFANSAPDQPDITLTSNGQTIGIHLVSRRKSAADIRSAIAPRGGFVLGIDLRAYARLWWEICDEKKHERIREAATARDEFRLWLSASMSGRGWISNPVFEERLAKLHNWLAHHRALAEARRIEEENERRKQEQLQQAEEEKEAARREKEKQEAIRRFEEKEARGPWRIPLPTPSQPVIAAGDHSPPKIPLMMKAVREDARLQLNHFLATGSGLLWHAGRKTWVFVGRHPNFVDPRARRHLDASAPWETASDADKDELMPPGDVEIEEVYRLFRPAPSSAKPEDSAVNEDEAPDTILRENIGKCSVCKGPVNEVRFSSGLYEGRRGIVCAANSHHPMKVLPADPKL